MNHRNPQRRPRAATPATSPSPSSASTTLSAFEWRVELSDRVGEITGNWVNFPNEDRARAFAADRIRHETDVFGVRVYAVKKGD